MYFLLGLSSEDEDRLIVDKFKNYNSLIRPVERVNASPVVVNFGLAMILLINVDEKNQIMQTNVWLTMKWTDYQLKWDPDAYGKIRTIRVPPDKVWLPDIVLFNNADGNYEVSFYSNVVIEHTGGMLWVPPAIYKSSCQIDVQYFPFDEQECPMIFGSWTFNEDEVQLYFLDNKSQVELNDYSQSGIWDIMDVPGHLIKQNSEVQFTIRIRRKTLFYTVILIIPTVLMAFLSMMVFYLPADASEKITLAISILLALVVFLLLVSKILPPTSSTIPLMAKYLLLTFVMNIITILVTVVIINVYFRGPSTHRMPEWVRRVFLDFLPKFLLMRRPKSVLASRAGRRKSSVTIYGADGRTNGPSPTSFFTSVAPVLPNQFIEMTDVHHPNCSLTLGKSNRRLSRFSRPAIVDEDDEADYLHVGNLPPEAYKAIEAIEYITEHLRQDDEYKKCRDEWKYISTVVDRLLLYTFFGVTAGGTLGILLSAPNVFEYVNQTDVIKSIQERAKISP